MITGDWRKALTEALTATADSGSGRLGSGSDPRAIARVHAAALASDIDRHWEAAKTAPDGPIDVIDVFCGCGGMSAGFKAVNAIAPTFRLAAAVDIDATAAETYSRNLGLTPTLADVHQLAHDHAMAKRLLVDARSSPHAPLVLIGCAPCQGFSSHRNAAGASDPRNSLFADFARVATKLEPDLILVENVPELLTQQYWHVLEEGRKTLRNAGYRIALAVHNMAEYGVPQQRFRVLMIAMRRNFRLPSGFLTPSQFRTVRDAIWHLAPIAAGDVHPGDPMHYTARHRQSTLDLIRLVPKNGGKRPPGSGPECLKRIEAKQGRAGYEDVYGRLWWDRPSITVTGYARNPASGRYLHPEQNRGLSVREAALLQGFPSDYQFAGGLDPSFKQIGNAVPPTFSAFLAAHMLGELLGPEIPDVEFDCGIDRPVGPSFARMIPGLKSAQRGGTPGVHRAA